RPLPRPARRRCTAEAAPRRAADRRGAGGARPLAADVELAQGDRNRRLLGRHLRARLHARRPRVRELAKRTCQAPAEPTLSLAPCVLTTPSEHTFPSDLGR